MKLKPLLTSVGTFIAGAHLATGQEAASSPGPAAAPPPLGPMEKVDRFFNGKLPDALAKGKFSLNARLRYEFADQTTLAESHAFTISPLFGFTTAPTYGFQAMLEGENVTSILDEDNYNAAGSNGQPGKTVIADPPTTQLNQAWLSYQRWNSTLKVGRQRLVLDNARFLGDVDWRQNMQTYDAVSFTTKPITNLTAFYSYLWEVHRVFGDVTTLPPANRDFRSDSHALNASYAFHPLFKLTGYSYLFDFDNSPGNSTATYGGNATGTWTYDAERNGKLNYWGEFAWQHDYHSSPLDYATEYYRFELSGDYSRFTAGAGLEVLGSDNGQGFRTPLATLAKFNGWANVFLTTPAAGLRDYYAFAQVKLPGELPLRFDYHSYESDAGSADFGQEFNLTLTRKFGKHWLFLARYAHYDGQDAPFAPAPPQDVDRFFAEINFSY